MVASALTYHMRSLSWSVEWDEWDALNPPDETPGYYSGDRGLRVCVGGGDGEGARVAVWQRASRAATRDGAQRLVV
eukprot:SAG22_NODE_13006_length_422_cov_0.479876_1_plen_76_part_00